MNNIVFSISNYNNHEDMVLKIRNKNRDVVVSREYLDWRYLENSTHPPVIFWVHKGDGSCVGMASLIFRRYWVDNEAQDVAVLGDISLDRELRGSGISTKLFRYINEYIEEHNCYAFVLPNNLASRGLMKAGWVTHEKLVSYVLLVNPSHKLISYHIGKGLSELLGQVFRMIIRLSVMVKNPGNYSVNNISKFDESFDMLWHDVPKHGLILRERSAHSLIWRYGNHPYRRYCVAKVQRGEQDIGYVIYSMEHDGMCLIMDIISKGKEHMYPMMLAFIKKQINNKDITTIRVSVNENNCLTGIFKALGFINRGSENIFQAYAASSRLESFRKHMWFVTSGDKDV